MLINFKDNSGSWGYYNSKTRKTIPAQFRDDSDFVDGFAVVKQCSNSLYGVIDEDGNDVIPFIFSLLERQDNGLFKAGSYYFNCLYNLKGDIVDADGTALENRFQIYDVVKAFGNSIYIFKKGATKGVIYKDKVIIEKDDPYHDYVEITPYLFFFRLKDSPGDTQYYNYEGKLFLPESRDLRIVSDKYIVFYNQGYGIANAIGDILLPAKYNEITHVGGDVFLLNYKKEQKDDDILVKYNIKLNSFIVKDDENGIAIPKSADWCGNFEEGKALIATNHKYGVIDINSNICVPCNYDEVVLGYETVAIVKNQDKYKLLDYVNGEIKAEFDEIKHLRDSYFVFKEKWCYGVIDSNGVMIIPAHYKGDIELLEDGNFRVSKGSGDNSYCIIDSESHIIILTSKGIVRLPNEIIWANNYSEGLAIVENSKGLYGAIDEQGRIVIPCQFSALSNFKDGFSSYYVDIYEKRKIDKSGKVILEDDTDLLSDSQFESVEKLCENRYLVQRKDDHFYAIVDRKNNIIVHFSPQKYYAVKKDEFGYNSDENVLYFSDDYRKVEALFYAKSGARIIPNPAQCVIINPEYGKTRGYFSDGLAAVSNKDRLWGFVDETGKEVVPCIYNEVHDFSNGYCVVSDWESTKLIDKQGRIILSGNFDKIEVCKDGSFLVTHEWFGSFHEICHTTDEYGHPTVETQKINDERKFNINGELLISLHGDIITLPKEYEWCEDNFHEGFLSVYKNGRWGVINTRLEQIFECQFDEKITFEDDIAIVSEKNQPMVVDTLGHILISGEYSDIKQYKNYNLFVCKTNQGDYEIYNGLGVVLFSSSTFCSRILIPGTQELSSNRFKPKEIIPIDGNTIKFSCTAVHEKRSYTKWGICRLNGDILVEACFDEIGGIGNGLVSVAKTFTKKGCNKKLWGYVDMKGNVVIDYKYANAKTFAHGVAQVRKEEHVFQDTGWGVIATDGKELTDFVYTKFSEHSSGDLLAYHQYYEDSPIRITEQGAIHYEYNEDGFTIGVDLYGYDWCSRIYYGLDVCIVMKGHRYGLIDITGKETLPLSEMGDVKIALNPNDYVCFTKGGEYKTITRNGRIITSQLGNRVELPIGIHWCDEWIDGYIAVESNGKWGLLNKELEFVLETKYESIQYIENKRVLCCSKENDKDSYSIYSIETDSFLRLPYYDCSHFENGCAIVSKVMKEIKHPWTNNVDRTYAYGLIDYFGHELLPCDYSKVQFKKPIEIVYSNHDDYEEPYDWESGYYDAFEDEPGASWGREW